MCEEKKKKKKKKKKKGTRKVGIRLDDLRGWYSFRWFKGVGKKEGFEEKRSIRFKSEKNDLKGVRKRNIRFRVKR